MRVCSWWIIVGACDGKGPTDRPDPGTTDTGSSVVDTIGTGDTGLVTASEGFEVSCALQLENVLRAVCTVILDSPQPVEVSFVPVDGGVTRVHAGDPTKADQEIGLYVMRPVTEYAWTARLPDDPASETRSGTFTTGLPPAGAEVVLAIDGASTAPLLGMISPCLTDAFAVIVDDEGVVVWYQDVASTNFGFLEALSFTEDHTVLAIEGGTVVEVDPMGNELLRLRAGYELEDHVHHDLFRRNGLTYLLFQETYDRKGDQFLLDGFYVFDGANLLATWHLVDYFEPITHDAGPFPDDYSHANSIWIDDAGQLLLSFRHLSGVLAIDGDVASPTFGDVRWALTNPSSELPSDFVLSSAVGAPDDFERQHNVWVLPDGRLSMLDNRDGFQEFSRVLELTVDPVAATAVIEVAYEIPAHCDFQGGAWRTPAGNPLATCAPTRTAYEFDQSSGALVWEAEVSCTGGVGTYIPRVVPVDW